MQKYLRNTKDWLAVNHTMLFVLEGFIRLEAFIRHKLGAAVLEVVAILKELSV